MLGIPSLGELMDTLKQDNPDIQVGVTDATYSKYGNCFVLSLICEKIADVDRIAMQARNQGFILANVDQRKSGKAIEVQFYFEKPVSEANPAKNESFIKATAIDRVYNELNDLAHQQYRWERGERVMLLIGCPDDVHCTSLTLTCDHPDAHMISAPMNALKAYYEQELRSLTQ